METQTRQLCEEVKFTLFCCLHELMHVSGCLNSILVNQSFAIKLHFVNFFKMVFKLLGVFYLTFFHLLIFGGCAYKVKENEEALTDTGNTEHRQYFVVDEKLSWKDASEACKKREMVLVAVDSFDKYMNFINYVRANNYMPEDIYSGYWIGGFRKSTSYNDWFRWENGKLVEFYGWLHDGSSPDGNCLELKWFNDSLGWSPLNCDHLHKYICADDNPHEEKSKIHLNRQTKRPEIHEEYSKNPSTTEATTTVPISQTATKPIITARSFKGYFGGLVNRNPYRVGEIVDKESRTLVMDNIPSPMFEYDYYSDPYEI